ncbi:branched-chain amino acid ABC transporter substrate-binding protein [Ectobacillus polymachus]|uniref:branched-chain amino acid ABC transporter substrate-binding protein n=1 Tax=Ectobacillus polymachus TaxID=1508806 RepID=UPI003A89D6CA
MRKITDERLILKNLKNIRIAFLFQTLCIIGILIYDGLTKGFIHVTDNPLWLVFMGTGIILSYLQMGISIDSEEGQRKAKQPHYYQVVLQSLAIGVIVGLIVLLGPEGTGKNAIILGAVMFFSFLCAFSYSYYLRKKRSQDEDDDDR